MPSRPTHAPSALPTISPTISHNPTFVPSANPTNGPTPSPSVVPTYAPTASPSYNPTVFPSVVPTYTPTASPSYDPTILPSVAPTYTPTLQPSSLPTALPTWSPTPFYNLVDCVTGEVVCKGTIGNDQFLITATSNVAVTGNSGNDIFKISPNSQQNKITITDFNTYANYGNLIDLTLFTNIQSFSQLTTSYDIVNSAVVVTLPDGQKIILQNNQLSNVGASDFVFYVDSASSTQSPTAFPTLNSAGGASSGGVSTTTITNIISGVVPTVAVTLLLAFSKTICTAAFDSWNHRIPDTIPGSLGKNIILYPCKAVYSSAYLQIIKDRDTIENEKSKKNQKPNDVEQNNQDSNLKTTQVSPNKAVMDHENNFDSISIDTKSPTKPVKKGNNQHDYLGLNKNEGGLEMINHNEASVFITDIKYDNPILDYLHHSNLIKDAKQLYSTKVINQLITIGEHDKDAAYAIVDEMKQSGNKKVLDVLFGDKNAGSTSQDPWYNQGDYNADLVSITLSLRNAIEYVPAIKHMVTNIMYPMVEKYLPEAAKNVSFPDVSSSMLLGTHLALGTVGAMMLPVDLQSTAQVSSTASSMSYGARLTASQYLHEYKGLAVANNFEVAKHCAMTFAAYTVPGLVTCAFASSLMTGYQCNELNIYSKLSLAGADCYAKYKQTFSETKDITPTESQTLIPYIADTVVAVAAITYNQNVFNIISAVVSTDYLSKIALDIIPSEVKEAYIEPGLQNIYVNMNDLSHSIYQIASNVETFVTDKICSIIGCTEIINLQADL